MKKLILFVAAVLALASCTGSDNTPKATPVAANQAVANDSDGTCKLADEAIKKHLSNRNSYKAMDYGQMDSCFTEILDFHAPYNEKADFYRDCYKKDLATNKAKAKADLDSANYYQQKDSVERATFEPQFFGWKMKVRYSADNIYEGEVYFDVDKTYATTNRYLLLKKIGLINR